MTEDRNLERNPLEEDVPTSTLKKAEHFAYVLAWGVDKNLWNSNITCQLEDDRLQWIKWENTDNSFSNYLANKWGDPFGVHIPDFNLFITLGYLRHIGGNAYTIQLTLTQKSFDLLEKPSKAPQVFISYRHATSSALALLIEARLKNKDSDINVFVDRSIKAGDTWHPFLDEQLEQSDILVCLLTRDTLDSWFVRKEINFALDNGKTVIAFCHAGYNIPDYTAYDEPEISKLVARLNEVQAINVVQPESAEEYEIALLKLFIALGYSTL